MEFTKDTIVTGKVTGITKFGAFVELAPNKSGLVYISEISNSFVKDIHDYLQEGQEVTVKIIDIDETGRIKLSIKQAARPVKEERPVRREEPAEQQPRQETAENSFEDKLKRFMKDSDDKISSLKLYQDKRGSKNKRH